MNVRINYQLAALAILFSTSSLMGEDKAKPAATSAATTPEVTPFMVPSLEEKFASEASKADAITTKAEAEATKLKKVAAEARLKGYKDKLAEITKTGDFDKAQQVKARITQLENDPDGEYTKAEKPTKRPRPKDTVKFGGHTYALIKEPAPWHVAKRRCEEMGGHLVCVETSEELLFIKKLVGNDAAWLGASDEEEEGQWKWVFKNKSVEVPVALDNTSDIEHVLGIYGGALYDGNGGHRYAYICEWE